MTCKCSPSLVGLRNQLDDAFPNRDDGSDGCCGDASHANTKSDHNPVNGYAHAFDIDEDVEPGHGDKPLLVLIGPLLRDSRTKYVIYERNLYYPNGAIKPYTGINAHAHHLHLSIKLDATFNTRPWPMPNWTPTPTPDPLPLPKEEEEMFRVPKRIANFGQKYAYDWYADAGERVVVRPDNPDDGTQHVDIYRDGGIDPYPSVPATGMVLTFGIDGLHSFVGTVPLAIDIKR